MKTIKEFYAENLKVKIFENRAQMGENAASDIADCIKTLLKNREEINIIFAAAPSQNDTIAALIKTEGIEWNRINAFHMDEYIGLSRTAPQRFGNFLNACLFSKVPFKSVNYIYDEDQNYNNTCSRYANLLKTHPIDIVCLGIGENGHIAFNDPWVADFEDKEIIKRVPLDEICRKQQVNDGCFKKLEDVPKYALTLTVPALFKADYLFCTVPAKTKREAVYNTVNAKISEDVPATIMRKHKCAVMYCDKQSGEKLLNSKEF